MIKISKHFSLEELCRTSQPYDNTPNTQQVINLCFGVHNILEPLRNLLEKPIIINSGFRSVQVNKAVGGVPNSQHLQGLAADIRVCPADIQRVFYILKALKHCDQVLGGRSFIHISWKIDGNPRQEYIQNYYNY